MDPLDDPWVERLQNVRQTCDRRVQVEKQMRGLVRKWHRNEDLATKNVDRFCKNCTMFSGQNEVGNKHDPVIVF